MATAITLQPEYQFYTSAEIVLHINGRNLQGDYGSSFTISKTGEFFQSLTIKEGTLDESGEQLAPDANGSNCANGEVKVYDNDNGIFQALVSSKGTGGSQLTHYMDIILKTYTGNREYRNCRISDWSLSFSEGVPVITFKWQRLQDDSKAPPNEPTKPAFNTSIIEKRFINEGFATFKEFVEAFNVAFTEKYAFVYSEDGSTTKLHPLGSDGKLPDGVIKFTYNDKRAKENGVSSSYEEIYRFAFKAQTKNLNTWSALTLIMEELCANCSVGEEKKSLRWRICDNNQLLLYAVINLNNIIEPNENTNDTLSNTVFVYNAAIKEAQLYKTMHGDMIAFPIESLSTAIQNNHVMVTNLESQANSQNPNGNAIITSGGRIIIPQGLPQAVTSAIMRMSSIYLQEQFTVDITVYNYIHFYTCGRTLVNLVVFDHLGQVMGYFSNNPMRVYKYIYTLDSNSGVIKAQVTLKPDFSADKQSFNNTTGLYLRDFVVNGYGNPIGVMPNPNEIVTDYSHFNANVTTTDAKDYEVSMNKLSLNTALTLYKEFIDNYAQPHQVKVKGKPEGKTYNHHIPASFLYKLVKANCIWLVDLIIGVAGYAIYFDDDAEASRVISKELLDEAGVRDPVLDYKKNAWTDITSTGKNPLNPCNEITTGVSIAHYNRSGLASFYRAEPITAVMPSLNEDGSIIYQEDGSYLTNQYTITYQGNIMYGWGMKSSSSTALHPSIVVKDPETHYLTNTTNGRVCLNGKLSDSNMKMIGPEYSKEGFMPYNEAQQFVAWCRYHLYNKDLPEDLLYPAALWMAKYWAPYFSWSEGQQHNSVQKTMLLAGMANSWGKTDASSVKALSQSTEEELIALFTAGVDNTEKSHRYRRILNIRRAIVLVDFIKRV